MTTKLHYGKLGGNVAYHGFQSFKENEVTPEECHSIGVETAKRMWGDEYEIVVTTHLDKHHHLHNHFVVNSVSFRTGRKFENHISDHYKLREISDAICKERGKSVLENAPFYGGEKAAYWLHKQGKKTHRDMLREDIEICLTVATSWDEFRKVLFTMGYEVDYRRFTIKAKDWERGVRVEGLGYTVEGIEKRFNETYYSGHHLADWNNFFYARRRCFPLESVRKKLEFGIEHGKRPEVIYVNTMFLLIILVFQLLKEAADAMLISPEMRHAAKDIKQYVADYHFLTDNQIQTTDDLAVTIDETNAKIAELEEKRRKADIFSDEPLVKFCNTIVSCRTCIHSWKSCNPLAIFLSHSFCIERDITESRSQNIVIQSSKHSCFSIKRSSICFCDVTVFHCSCNGSSHFIGILHSCVTISPHGRRDTRTCR